MFFLFISNSHMHKENIMCDSIRIKEINLNRNLCDFTQLHAQIDFFYSNGITHNIFLMHTKPSHA